MDDGLQPVLASLDVAALERYLVEHSGLPGPRLNLRLAGEVADAVADPVYADLLLPVLGGWLTTPPAQAPVTDPGVMLPCTAAITYGALATTAPERFDEADNRLYGAASDPRWRVREAVTHGLQRMLHADWDGTAAVLLGWAEDEDLLVVRAAAAGVAEPPLLKRHRHARAALEIQRRAVHALQHVPAAERRTEPARVLRQALGFTISVAVAATGEFALLHELHGTDDPDLLWIVRENAKKARLHPWPEELAKLS